MTVVASTEVMVEYLRLPCVYLINNQLSKLVIFHVYKTFGKFFYDYLHFAVLRVIFELASI